MLPFYLGKIVSEDRLWIQDYYSKLKVEWKTFFFTLIISALFNLQLDVAIDGADDVDCDLTAIKGGGYTKILYVSLALFG